MKSRRAKQGEVGGMCSCSVDDCELADAESQRAAHRLTTIRSGSRTWYPVPAVGGRTCPGRVASQSAETKRKEYSLVEIDKIKRGVKTDAQTPKLKLSHISGEHN